MDDTLKEQLILKDYLSTRGVDLDENKFKDFYSIYQSRRTGGVGDIVNRTKAGSKSAVAAGQIIGGDFQGATENIKEAASLRQEDPLLDKRISEISDPDSIPQTLLNLVKDPKAAVALLGESLPASIAGAAAALPIGRGAQAVVKGGPHVARAVGAATFGGVTGAAEYGSTILETLAESGVDITNPSEIEAVILHPEIGPKLKEKGLKRGVPIAAFDAVSFGIAGKLAQLGAKGLAGEAAVQAGLGGAGEASAQLVDEGKITDKGAIGLEIGLEAATGTSQAVVVPALENVLQGTPEASTGEVFTDIPKTEDVLKEITQIDEDGPVISEEQSKHERYNKTAREARERLETIKKEGVIQMDTGVEVAIDSPLGISVIEGMEKDVARLEEIASKQAPAPKDTELESKVRQGEKRADIAPEVARGTPKQMESRLLRLNKADLFERATKFAGIEESAIEGKTKKEVASLILGKYGIDTAQQDKVQTAKVEPVATKPKEVPDALKGINEPTRKELLKAAKKINNEDVAISDKAKAADNWLSQLPDNVLLSKNLIGLSRNKKGLNFTGKTLEEVNQSVKKIKSKNTSDDTKVKATGALVKSLKDSGYFAPDEVKALEGATPELTKFVQAKYDTGTDEGSKQLVSDLLTSPRTRDAVVGEIFNDFKEGRQAKVDTPAINRLGKKYAKFIESQEVPSQRLDRDPTLSSEKEVENNKKDAEEISEYEAVKAVKVMKNNAEVPDAIWDKENYGLDRDAYKASGITGPYKGMLRSFDFMKTMVTKARHEPIFQPFVSLYRSKDAFREQLFRQHLNDFILLKERHGIKRLEGATAVLEEMTGPHNKVGAQALLTNDAGQIRFKGSDGVSKVVDLGTSEAIQDLQKVFKQQLLIEMQTFKNRAAELHGFDPEAQRQDMLNKIDDLRALGEDVQANNLEATVENLDNIEKLYRSNKAYYPHNRNRGPYSIATYRESDGKYELAGLYSVKSDKFGNVDSVDAASVQARIQNDQEKYGETFYTSKGDNISGATPFLMTYDNLRKNIMRDAKNPNIAYEALSNLLTNKNVDPDVLNKVFDDLSFDSDTERFFANYRDKKNYYGYDNDDPISSMIDSLNARSAMLTRFQYNAPLNKLYAEASQDLQKLGRGGRKTLGELTRYYEYMNTPADDAAKIREITFWYFLAGNPSTSLLQLMSTYMNTLPWMAQYTGPVGFLEANVKSFTTSLYKAGKVQKHKALLTKRTIPEFSKRAGISQEDSKILLSLYERGVLDPGYAIDAVNYSRNQEKQRKIIRGEKPAFGPVGAVGGKLKDIGQGMIQVTEDVARMNSALLILDSIKSPKRFEKLGKLLYNTDPLFKGLVNSKYDGVITKEAILEHGVDENHAVFGKLARPEALRSKAGAGLFAFLQYPISILEQMIRLLTTRGLEGKKAALNMLIVYPILFGGMTAIPGYETWDWMTKWLQRLTGEGRGPTNLDIVLLDAMESIGIKDPKTKDLIMKGPILSGGADIDASQRIAVQFPLQPFMDVFAAPESNGMTSQSQALQFLGPLATIPTGAMNMLNRIEGGAGAGEAFVDSLAPVWLKNIKKAEDIRKGELRNTRGKRMLPSPEEAPELFGGDVTDEYIRQFMGLRPAVASEASRAHYYQGLEQSAVTSGFSKKHAIIAKAIVSRRNGEEGASRELAKSIAELVKFNAAQPEPKTRAELVRGLKMSIKGRIEAEENPLQQRKHIGKKKQISQDVKRYGLPRVKGSVEDREAK